MIFCTIIGGLLQYRGHLPWMLLIDSAKTATISVEENVDPVKYIFCILHKNKLNIQCLYEHNKYIQHTHGHRWTARGFSRSLGCHHCYRLCIASLFGTDVAMLLFHHLKKRSSVMTWFLSEYKKGDTVKFSTWPFLWAVYTAFGLSVDPLTRAFKCKHGWWMAMLIKWAELAVFIRFIKVFVLYKTFKRVWSVGGTAVLFMGGANYAMPD